ncbi:MAG: Hsp20/alpha crystallin family protein, partial [Synergistaceae bacterium]|nr:Hsp20/alpha crystallin family protein [Synergistaceae bacterium]
GKIFAEFEIPGIDPSKVELNVYEDRLELRAEKSDEKTLEQNNVLRSERYFGTVSRSIQFPVEVDPDSAKASFKNGVLTVEVAERVQSERMKKVEIEA